MEVLEEYKNWAAFTQNLAPKTVYGNYTGLKTIFRKFPLNKINYSNILKYFQKLREQGRSPYHIKRLRSALLSYCEFLIWKKKLRENWVKKIPVPKTTPRIPETLTVEEIEKIINFPVRKNRFGYYDYYWNLFFELLAKTGMRLGEVRNLLINDLNFSEKIITIRNTKTNEPRIIPIPPDMIDKLKEWIKDKKPSEYLFKGHNNSVPVCEAACQEELRERTTALSIKKRVHPHIFRHSFITELLRQDVAISKVQRIVGHRNLKTTMIYTHLLVDDLKKAMLKHPLIKKSLTPEIIKKEIEEFLVDYKNIVSKYKIDAGENYLRFCLKF